MADISTPTNLGLDMGSNVDLYDTENAELSTCMAAIIYRDDTRVMRHSYVNGIYIRKPKKLAMCVLLGLLPVLVMLG